MSWLDDALNDQEGRELVEAIHERKAAAEGAHAVDSQPEGTFCTCGFAPDDAMDRSTQYREVEEHVEKVSGVAADILSAFNIPAEWDTIKDVPLQRVADIEEREQTAREREAAAMWDQLPPFMRGHLLKALPENPDEPGREDYSHGDLDPEDIGEADVICSSHEEAPDLDVTHRPVLDIDFPAALIPSTTPGHFHLYLDKPMGSIKYFKLLEALAEAGIIQGGYAGVSKARGYTSVRLPWVAKATPTTEEPNE